MKIEIGCPWDQILTTTLTDLLSLAIVEMEHRSTEQTIVANTENPILNFLIKFYVKKYYQISDLRKLFFIIQSQSRH